MTSSIVVALDIGPPSSKAVARLVAASASRPGRPYAEQPTPWQTDARGQTEIHPNRLVSLAVDLIGSAVRAAESAWGPVRVRGIGATGLAQSGVPLHPGGHPAAPGDGLVAP